ncbi:pyrroloquinoline quinone-dependent dehydrogenase [Candidatus Rariloculus sp.]|uniref:pyrroloquinoline quinone-dependent dehydrogenase n=1 Tax=Candidatus Rariloculus sp. TaxID=3101265 RepID=UPI003D0EFC23
MKRFFVCAALIGALISSLPSTAQQTREFVPVTDEMLQSPDPGDWLSWRRTTDGWGYSPLDQIDAGNVAGLELVWKHPVGTGIHEGTPLVYDRVMYMPSANDYIQAFDAKTGEPIWEYQRDYPEGARGGTNRNIAIWGDMIINASGDNHMYALDARTGRLVWETPVIEATLPARASSGPIIAGGRVITGRQCQPGATHESCIVTAHDASTGRELWRARTIPRPGEPGDETWGDVPLEQRWHVGTWMVPSYDPELDLIFVGTSVTIPAPKFILGGNDNQHLYHNSTLALDGDSGEIVWYYQHVVDHWDLDHPFERLLVDTAVAPDPDEVEWINPAIEPGERRQVVTGIPGKTGIVYTLDRATGEFLWARTTLMQNVVSEIDGATGEVTVNPDTLFTAAGQEIMICPAAAGGRNWPAGAYSPLTNAMYVPMQNTCMDASVRSGERDPSLVYGLDMPARLAPGADNLGSIWAVSAETGEALWRHDERSAALSLVATGGGLVFGGDSNGRFKAFDDKTGAILWETNLEAPVSGFPVSFAVDGRQYVAVSTGPSLVAATASRLLPELEPGTGGSNVFVFALPVGNGP